ncbi:MAG: hypothetical protein SGBAC_012007 [Bacillariaceae sp.]
MIPSSSTSSPIITSLNFSDVQVDGTFSMINTIHPHPGNRVFARILQKNRILFQSCQDLKHKKLLVLSMIMAIQKNGGRFVQKNTADQWVTLSNKEAFGFTIQALKQDGKMPLRPSILLKNRKRESIFKSVKTTEAASKKVTISC